MGTSSDIIRALYEAFGKGDVPAVLGVFDPKIEWREAEGYRYADGNPYIGPQAVAEGVFQRIVAEVREFAVRPETFIDGGNTVVVEGRYTGTLNTTGRPLDAQFAHVWELRGGKAVRFQQYTDTGQWTEALRA